MLSLGVLAMCTICCVHPESFVCAAALQLMHVLWDSALVHFTHCAAAHWNWEKTEIVIRSHQAFNRLFVTTHNFRLLSIAGFKNMCVMLASQKMLLVFFFYLIGRGGPDKRTVWLLAKLAMFVGLVGQHRAT